MRKSCLVTCFITIFLHTYFVESQSSPSPTVPIVSCDINGDPNQTGLATQVAQGADGITTITLPCSVLISLDRGARSPTTNATARINGTSTRTTSQGVRPQFIRPSVNPGTAGCDIYGPIDQLGSIVVGVNLTSTTSATTVPCSSYLSFQSSAVLSGGAGGRAGLGGTCADPEYQISFGRSPQCTSYANGKLEYRPRECGTDASGYMTGPPLTQDPQTYCNPPCLVNPVRAGAANYNCCGNCHFSVDQVKVLYWPTETVKPNCPRVSGSLTKSGTNSTKTLNVRADGVTTEVSDGFTYTFPSFYVSVVGTAAVSDSCGPRGAVQTNPTPVAVSAITTISYPTWPSHCGAAPPRYDEAVTKVVAESDLECPTWGLSDPFMTTCDGSAFLTSTVGEPFNPIIIAPSELLSIDPEWSRCSEIESTGPFLISYGLYDPPQTLNAADALAPGATPDSAPTPKANPKPQPKPLGSLMVPEPTTKPSPKSGNGGSQPRPGNSPDKSAAPEPTNDPPSTPVFNPDTLRSALQPSAKAPPKAPSASNSPPEPSSPNVNNQTPPSEAGRTTFDLNAPSLSGGIGNIINSAMGGAPPVNAPTFTPHGLTVGGQTLSVNNPSAVVVAGTTLNAGGPPATVGGNYYSLAPSGSLVASGPGIGEAKPPTAVLTFEGTEYTANSASQLVVAGQTLALGGVITVSGTPISQASDGSVAIIGGSSQSILPATPTSGNAAVLTFGGSTYTANPTSPSFVVGGLTLTPGGVITVSGTPISLDSAGRTAVIGGSSTQGLSSPLVTPGNILTVGGQTFTANPTAFSVDGTTISAGGPGINVGGTTLSLQSGGSLVIGSSTVTLPTGISGSPTNVVNFTGAAPRMILGWRIWLSWTTLCISGGFWLVM